MNNRIKEYMLNIEVKYNSFSNGLKLMVVFICLFTLFLIWQQFVTTLFFSAKGYSDKIKLLEKETRILSNLAEKIKHQKPVDIMGNLQKKYATLSDNLVKLEKELIKYHAAVSSESEMFNLVKKIIKNDPDITLSDLKNLPKKELLKMNEGILYQNPVQMIISGKFNSIYDYLRKVEALDINLHWDEMLYIVKSYPEATVTFKYHIITIQGENANVSK